MTPAHLAGALRGLSPRGRIVAAVALALLIAIAAAGAVATRDTRIALFALPLRGDQLAEVEQRLAGWGVPYAVTTDNVRVDRGRRSDLLLRLALAGVPHPHLAGSDEALAHVGPLTPQSVLEAQTRDALAADLALGLRGLEGVADARVVIAAAAAGMYADESQRDASASVRITLVPGTRLSARVVAGIKAFVAGGVPALDPARVSVVDDRGVVMGADEAPADAADVQTALQSALDDAFGAGATIVRVRRELLGEKRDVRETRRRALAGAIARTSSDERYASAGKHYAKSSGTEDRGSETREEHRSTAADSTARLSVAVFVDAARRLDLAKIRAFASATAGLRDARGDVLRVESIAFGRSATPDTTIPARRALVLAAAGLFPQAVTALALILIAAFALKPLLGTVVRLADAAAARRAVRDTGGLPPARVRTALVGEPPHVAAAIISALPTATAAAVLELYPPEERRAIVRRLGDARTTLVPAPEELLRGA